MEPFRLGEKRRLDEGHRRTESLSFLPLGFQQARNFLCGAVFGQSAHSCLHAAKCELQLGRSSHRSQEVPIGNGFDGL
ncbi:MAG TPA: hypothetical protein VIS74_05640 [Chthoniobacterales bacterium]